MPSRPTDLPAELLPPAELPWFKRLAARLLGKGLNTLKAQHRPSWFHGHASGHRAGREEGERLGYDEGRAAGYEEGRQVLIIRDQRAEGLATPGLDDALFDDWRLPITPDIKKRMKADVTRLLPGNAQPSTAQWKLIFSDTPSTCVVAGAGAGKSTSLVLRIILLTQYLGFELDSFTVVTFTRESRKDFITRLTATLALWGCRLDEKAARGRVRTFHAQVLPWVRSLPGFSQLQAFETLHQGPNAEDSGSNPFSLQINEAQRQQLNLCYQDLLKSSERFAELIGLMRRQALQLKPLDPDHPDVRKRLAVLELASQRDEELCDTLEDMWFRAGAWPIKGIEPDRETLQVKGYPFHCHGYIPSMDAWVVLGYDPSEGTHFKRPGAKLPVWAEWVIKRTLFQSFNAKPLIWLENYASAKRLLTSLAGDAVAGPGFDYKVQGELAAAPLLDAFVSSAGFLENLGLEVAKAVSGMSFAAQDPDRWYFEALALFWPAFEAHLMRQNPPVMTYNRMFALFGENSPENLKLVGDALLRPMAHLMIDEFQDVSPQIVSWLRASLREIRRRGPSMQQGRRAQHSSLMCVGDDWQSIYGWRGSSPQFFMAFTQAFPAPAHTRVMLTDNYRSHGLIIAAAEHVVRGVAAIAGKKAKAAGPQNGEPVPVVLMDRDESVLAGRIAEHYEHGDSILVLYRKGTDKSFVDSHLKQLLEVDYRNGSERRLRCMTYHSAKGLQADTVFLLGDCQHLGRSPFKNQAYRLARLGSASDPQAYDTAQHEEAMRLAYVGITRARHRCYWVLEKPSGEGAGAPRASDKAAGAKGCFDDQRA